MSHCVTRRVVFAGLVLAAALAADSARAVDSAVLSAVYGEGMKAFYAGRYTEAFQTFSQAIEGGSQDPRCYYFRGLSQLRLGRAPDAKLDFEKGAELEGKDFDLFYNVSKSLGRVQGSERMMLEQYRAAGRKNALAEIEKIRFEYFRRFTPKDEAVAGAATVSSGEATASATPADATTPAPAATAPAADPSNPFGGQPAAPATPATPAAPATNPFGTP
jgi:hypothetical protein